MSSSSDALPVLVATQKYILYINYIIFIAGLIGNTLNIIVFTNLKVFRGNRSAFYLIVESIVDIVLLCNFVVTQIFQLIYGTDPINISLVWCKSKITLFQSCRLLIGSIICFEALDQFSFHQSSILSSTNQYT